MDDVIFSYRGTNRQNQVRRYVVRQMDSTSGRGRAPATAANWPTSSTGSLAGATKNTSALGMAGAHRHNANCPAARLNFDQYRRVPLRPKVILEERVALAQYATKFSLVTMGLPKFTPFPFDDYHPHLIHPSLDRPLAIPNGIGIFQPFCHSTLSGQTHK